MNEVKDIGGIVVFVSACVEIIYNEIIVRSL